MMDKKVNENVQEIKDDELDFVAGGKYSEAEWSAMSEAERVAAKRNSAILISQKKASECKLVN